MYIEVATPSNMALESDVVHTSSLSLVHEECKVTESSVWNDI